MAEVASASIALLPTFKGGAAAIEKALGPSLTQAGSRAGATYGNSFSTSLSSVLGSLPVGQISGLAAVAATLTAGFNRFTAIDNAKAKLTALGFSAQEVAQDLDSAKQSVLGTQFALGDAATAAAGAIASGVSQGAALTRYLGLIADTAAISGAALSDVSLVFNQITSAGRLYTQDANQLVSRGIPVYKLLAEQYGVTSNELRKMIEQGEVDSDTFFKVIEKNIGGSAKSFDSLAASFANFQAGVGRAGEAALTPVLKEISTGLKDATVSLDSALPALTSVGAAFGGVASFANGLPGPIQAAGIALLAFTAARKPLGALNDTVLGSVSAFKASRDNATTLSAAQLANGSAAVRMANNLGTAAASARAAGVASSQARVFVAGLGGEIVATSGKAAASTIRMTAFATAAKGAGSAVLGAFGGPVGLGVTVAITAITAGLSAWTGATQAQKAATDALTASLDQNTGAVSVQTRSTIFDRLNAGDLKGTINALDTLKLSTNDYLDAILAGGPAQDAYRKKLQDAFDSAEAGSPALLAARKALDSFDTATSAVSSSQAELKKRIDAGVVGTEKSDAAATEAAKSYETFSDAVDEAFSGLTNSGGVTSALSDLADGLAESKTGFNDLTTDGVANTAALQDAVSALATQADGDNTKLVGSVMGLLSALRASGTDTTNVVGVVNTALKNLTGQDWTVYLNGSQSVAEATRVAKAALKAAEAQRQLADPSDRGQYNQAISIIKTQISDLGSLGSVASKTASQYNTYSQAATKAATATKSGSSATKKAKEELEKYGNVLEGLPEATEAQTTAADRFKAMFENTDAVSGSGLVLTMAQVSAAYGSMTKAANDAFAAGKITQEQRNDLLGTADEWAQSAIEAGDRATEAISAVFDAAGSWLTPSTLSSGAQGAIQSVQDAFFAGAITAVESNELGAAIRQADKDLADSAKAREKIADKLADANADLAAAISARDTFKKSIVDGYKALGDLAKLGKATEEQVTTYERIGNTLFATTSSKKIQGSAATIISGLKDQVKEAKEFKAAYEALQAAGLNDASLQNLVTDFLSTGDSSLSESILAGGSGAVSEINSLTGELGVAGEGLGEFASQKMFQAGVDAKQGIVDGLLADDAALVSAAETIGNTLIDTIRRTLDEHSPSKKTALSGKNAVLGLAGGMEDNRSVVEEAAANSATAVTDAWNNNLALTAAALDADLSVSGSAGSAAAVDRPIYADGIGLMGWVRLLANGEARLVFNTADLEDAVGVVR